MIRLALAVLTLAGLGACGGSGSGGAQADIAVTNSGPGEVLSGEAVEFTITVSNVGAAEATDLALRHHLDGADTTSLFSCAANGGAQCPDVLGEQMTLARLPAGGGLTFRIDVPSRAGQTGAITSTMTVSAAADSQPDNNRSEATATLFEARSGDYTVYASTGEQLNLNLDFGLMRFEMSGAQIDTFGTRTLDADGSTYRLGSTGGHLRLAPDLAVGSFDFGTGLRPFVAARLFEGQLSALAGSSYNLLGVNLRRNGLQESAVLPSEFGDGVMRVCQSTTPTAVPQCPPAELASYTLSTDGDEFTGVWVGPTLTDTVHFRAARSGSSLVLLRAGVAADATGRHFRVGLPEATSLAGGSFRTASTRGAWGTTTLLDTHYAYLGTTPANAVIDESFDLLPLGGTAPTGLRRGQRAVDAATLIVTQGEPLVVSLGARKGPAQGMIDIGIR